MSVQEFLGYCMIIIIIINTRGQIENLPIENTRFAGRKWLLAGR